MAKRKMPEVKEEIVDQVVEEIPVNDEPVVKTVDCELLNIRADANPDSAILGTLSRGTNILVAGEEDGWSKLSDRSGYVMTKFIK